MNELTEAGPLNEALARRWGIQGRSVHTMASDLFPVVSIDDERMDAALLLFAGVHLCSGFSNDPAAGATFTSHVMLQNPFNSGVVATMMALDILVDAGGSDVLICANRGIVTAPDSSAKGFVRDARRGLGISIGRSALDVSNISADGATVGESILIIQAPPDTFVQYPWRFVLPPGSQVVVRPADLNTAIRCNFHWLERRQGRWETTP